MESLAPGVAAPGHSVHASQGGVGTARPCSLTCSDCLSSGRRWPQGSEAALPAPGTPQAEAIPAPGHPMCIQARFSPGAAASAGETAFS